MLEHIFSFDSTTPAQAAALSAMGARVTASESRIEELKTDNAGNMNI